MELPYNGGNRLQWLNTQISINCQLGKVKDIMRMSTEKLTHPGGSEELALKLTFELEPEEWVRVNVAKGKSEGREKGPDSENICSQYKGPEEGGVATGERLEGLESGRDLSQKDVALDGCYWCLIWIIGCRTQSNWDQMAEGEGIPGQGAVESRDCEAGRLEVQSMVTRFLWISFA